MFSQLFILSFRGETIIFKNYRQDITLESPGLFFEKIHQKDVLLGNGTIFNIDGDHYIHVKLAGIYVVLTTKQNISPAVSFELLNTICRLINDFCGGFSEENIRNNASLVYEILDEIADYGYPQVTSSDSLKPFIFDEAITSPMEEVTLSSMAPRTPPPSPSSSSSPSPSLPSSQLSLSASSSSSSLSLSSSLSSSSSSLQQQTSSQPLSSSSSSPTTTTSSTSFSPASTAVIVGEGVQFVKGVVGGIGMKLGSLKFKGFNSSGDEFEITAGSEGDGILCSSCTDPSAEYKPTSDPTSSTLDWVQKLGTLVKSKLSKPTIAQIPSVSAKEQPNEIYCDLVEKLVVVISPTGAVIRCEISGRLSFKNYLNGNPTISFGLTENIVVGRDSTIVTLGHLFLDDLTFHPNSQLDNWGRLRQIDMVPPSGSFLSSFILTDNHQCEFVALEYRIDSNFDSYQILPFRVIPIIVQVLDDPKRFEFTVRIRSEYHDLSTANVLATIPVPRVSTSVSLEIESPSSNQRAEYDVTNKKIFWGIKSFKGNTDFALKVKILLPPEGTFNLKWAQKQLGPINLDFNIFLYTLSGISLTSLKVNQSGLAVLNFKSPKEPIAGLGRLPNLLPI